nr:hypothetical protein [Deltaproteobacteria bacterium]
MLLKFLRATGGEFDPNALRLVRSLRALRHPVVPSVLNHGVHNGLPWVASEDVPGASLGTMLDQARVAGAMIDLGLIRAAFEGVAAALTAAHTAPLPVFHGALTPGSVIVLPKSRRGPTCALLDLGLAPWLAPPPDASVRSARMLAVRAPELSHGTIGVGTDVFALGALLTELLAVPAAVGQTLVAVTAIRRRPDVAAGVWMVLERAMAVAPEQRFRSVDTLTTTLAASWSEVPAARSVEATPVAGAPARSSLLETVAPTAQPGPRLDTPAATVSAPVTTAPTPILGPMPALLAGPPAPAPTAPARPSDWQNPWATAMIQGKPSTIPPPIEDPFEQTIMEGVAPRSSNAGMTLADEGGGISSLGATLPMGFLRPEAEAPLNATLIAATPRPLREASTEGTLIAPPPRARIATGALPAHRAPAAPTTNPTLPVPATRSGPPVVVLVVGFVLAFFIIAAVAYRIGSH